jgi:DNA-binding MarR family transcriptional regulator
MTESAAAADPAEIGAALRDVLALATSFERKLGRTLSVNPTDLRAMEHLIASGALTPTELADRLDISTAASTLVVDRLVELGHVRRGPHPSDRRRILVRAEPASEERALGEVQPMVDGVRRAIGALSAAERATVLRFLDDVRGVYRDAVAEPVADVI